MKTLVIEEDMPLVMILLQYLAQGCGCFMIDTGPDPGDEEGGWATRSREEIVSACGHDDPVEMRELSHGFYKTELVRH